MSFMVRRISYQSNSTNQEKCQKIVVQPNKIVFEQLEHNRISISKLTIRNTSPTQITFTITQPKQTMFRVRYNKTVVPPETSLQIFVFLNPQNLSKSVSDQFIITFNKDYSIYVPITASNSNKSHHNRMLRRSSGMLIKSKQNVRIPQKKRMFRSERRKNCIAGQNKEYNDQIKLLVTLFEDKFEQIQRFVMDKTIKNDVFIGEKPISKEKHLSIVGFNLRMELIAQEQNKNKVLSRYNLQFCSDGPNIQNFKQIKPKWDKQRNNHKITLRKAMSKFTEEVRKIVVSYRFKKMHRVLQIYRQMNEQLNIQQVQSAIIPNHLDNQFERDDLLHSIRSLEEEQEEDEKLKKSEYLCRKIQNNVFKKSNNRLGADFNEFTLTPHVLEQDFGTYSSKNQQYEIKPMIGFDNWISLEQSITYNFQIMNYSKTQPLHIWQSFPPINIQQKRTHFSQQNQNNLLPLNDLSDLNINQPQIQQFLPYFGTQFCPYKMYNTNQNDSIAENQVYNQKKQIDKLVTQTYVSSVFAIKVQKQFFQHFHTDKDRNMFGMERRNERMIYRVSKDDEVDFDELRKIDRIKLQHLDRHDKEVDENILKMEQIREREWKGRKQDEVNYEALLANIEKIKMKRLSMGLNKILWTNRVVKRRHNMIFF